MNSSFTADRGRSPAARHGRAQRGIGAVGILALLVLVVGAGTLALKVIPHYTDFYTMRAMLQKLPPEQVHGMQRRELVDVLQKRFKINNLRDFDIRDIISLERSKEATVLTVSYERREHLFLNLDVVTTFQDTVEFPR